MDLETIGIAVLGLVLGPLSLVTYQWVAQRLDRNNPDPGLLTSRGQAQTIFAFTAALVAMSAVWFIGLWTFDLYPLYQRARLFFSFIVIGWALYAVGVRVVRWVRGS